MNKNDANILKQILETDLEISEVQIYFEYCFKLPYYKYYFTTSDNTRKRKINPSVFYNSEEIKFIRNSHTIIIPIDQLINYQRYIDLQVFA